MSNTNDTKDLRDCQPVSRREFLTTTGTGLAALAAAGCAPAQQDCIEADGVGVVNKVPQTAPTAPFDAFRDWIGALDVFEEIDAFCGQTLVDYSRV